ncbi:MAG: YihY/virulence factor BrkB family protein [Kofleriaceae bacterium]|nr:YihY/virulence factor BrkB family protein [Kofleriaceae bacterium]MBP9203567.1 YihY/virulence factor BrkB family protein [Kofleriaceae bacterium]
MRFWQRAGQWVDGSDATVARWLRAAREALLGEMPILAGGTALFAMIAVVPTLAAVVSLYGVMADPGEIGAQLGGLDGVLPPAVVRFVSDQLTQQAQRSRGELGLALAVSVVVAVMASRGAARALIDSLNRAYRVREQRTPLHKLLVTIAMASGTLVALLLMFAVIVALPGLWIRLHVEQYALMQWLRWPALMLVLGGILMALYRYAPSPRAMGAARQLWPGAAIGSVLLVVVSVGLSQWVERMPAYSTLYGAFGSVVVVMSWFYLSVLALVLGGFVNAELERRHGAPAPDRSMY